MKKFIVLATFMLIGCQPEMHQIVTPESAENEKNLHCNDSSPLGFPQFKYQNGNFFFCHERITGEYNPLTSNSVWVSYFITRDDLKSNNEIFETSLRPNPNLPDKVSPYLSSYEKASKHFEPRRWIPLDYFKNDKLMMAQSSYLTNVFPMAKQNKKLMDNTDKLIKRWVEYYGEAYVVSGSLFFKNEKYPKGYISRYVGEFEKDGGFKLNFKKKVEYPTSENLMIPTYVYKLILFPKQKFNIVLMLPNEPVTNTNPLSYIQSLKTLENVGFLKFYPLVTKESKAKLLEKNYPKDLPTNF